MHCNPQEIKTLASLGLVEENRAPNIDGISEMCRGFAEAWASERNSCPECFEKGYGHVIRDPNPLKRLLEFVVSERCAEYISRVREAQEVCRRWLRAYGLVR